MRRDDRSPEGVLSIEVERDGYVCMHDVLCDIAHTLPQCNARVTRDTVLHARGRSDASDARAAGCDRSCAMLWTTVRERQFTCDDVDIDVDGCLDTHMRW